MVSNDWVRNSNVRGSSTLECHLAFLNIHYIKTSNVTMVLQTKLKAQAFIKLLMPRRIKPVIIGNNLFDVEIELIVPPV